MHYLSNWHQSEFIRFRNIVFTSLITDERTDGRKDGRTDGQVENIMPPPASLAWRSVKMSVVNLIEPVSDFAETQHFLPMHDRLAQS